MLGTFGANLFGDWEFLQEANLIIVANNVARVTDTTYGYCLIDEIYVNGTITTGAASVKANGLQVARIGDTVVASCGHTGLISSGALKTKSEDEKIARLGDNFTGDYSGNITSASPNVYAG